MELDRRTLLAAGAAAPAVAGEARAAPGAPTADLTLWYDKPAGAWTEALPVGNGRLGAMVFGGVAEERLQLNEDFIWSGGPYDPVNPEALAALPEVRRLVFAGRYQAAQELAEAKLMARPLRQMAYQAAGDLRLSFTGLEPATDYRRSLDLDAAGAETRFRTPRGLHLREVFASAPDQVLALRLTCDRPGQIDVDLSYADPVGGKVPALRSTGVEGRDLVVRGRGSDDQGVAGRVVYEVRTRVLAPGGRVTPGPTTLQVRGADSVVLLLSIATNRRNFQRLDGDPTARNRGLLAQAAAKGFERLRDDQRADHRRLFRRVSLDLGRTAAADRPTDRRVAGYAEGGDPALAALYYQFGRYLLISCSRPGGEPSNLQGLWNDRLDPPWGGKYTININTEMNYWPAEPTGLAECVEPLVEMVQDLTVTGARTARAMYGADGWVAHHNTDAWRATAPVDGARYGVWPMGGAWLCQQLWDRYDYGRDRAELERVYPALKGAAAFFLDTLQPHPNGRWLVTNPSLSPENAHHEGSVALSAGPTMDNQILRDLFDRTAQAAEILGRDAEFRRRLRAARERLPPDRIGAQGQLQEWLEDWDAQAPEIHHRHVSHLYGLYPSGQISLDHTPELAAAARRSLEIRGDEATGWGLAWRLNLWARLREPEHAHQVLAMLLSPSRTYPNLFDAHPPFQIDGNFGGVSGMTEMLLQSLKDPQGRDEVLLLPALPAAWSAGQVSGLRARGGLDVSIAWRDGRLDRAELRALRAGRWRLRCGAAARELTLAAGRRAVLTAGAGGLTLRPSAGKA